MLIRLTQHPSKHRPSHSVFLAVDQELGEGAGMGFLPVGADPVGPLEVGSIRTWGSLGSGSGTEGVPTLLQSALEFVETHGR